MKTRTIAGALLAAAVTAGIVFADAYIDFDQDVHLVAEGNSQTVVYSITGAALKTNVFSSSTSYEVDYVLDINERLVIAIYDFIDGLWDDLAFVRNQNL